MPLLDSGGFSGFGGILRYPTGGGGDGPTRQQIAGGRSLLDELIRRGLLTPPGPILPTNPPPAIPSIPSVGTTTPDSTTSGTTESTPPATTTGETDRERRRRERAEAQAVANRRTNVSILSAFQTGLGILSGIGSLRERFGSGPVTALYPRSQGGTLTALPNLGALTPPAMPGTGMRTVGGFGTTANGRHYETGRMQPPGGYHWAKDGSGKMVRNRQMNVLNLSAAKRAIRRIKGARKVLRSIESSLPKRATSSAFKRKR